ncbi:type I 3-dehydroquinate dehydratase [Georgenia sp. Z1344]|uniref:type I 3-dehydroquinate dehydratase n=1 Tax=Georgenia sp. Z1344 TaxID=3416706 RepID=UPI003CEA6997
MPEPTAALALRGVTLTADRPLVVVPVVTAGDAAERASEAVEAGADVVEWRIDLAYAVTDGGTDPARAELDGRTLDSVLAALPAVVAACAGAPLMVTWRTTSEGGAGEASPDAYVRLVGAVAAVDGVDLVDVEADHPAAADALAVAREAPARPAVVLSHHDFDRTPAHREIVDRLAAMEDAGADVAKIAVTPRTTADVLALLTATAERAAVARVPLITMAMGTLGAPTRLVGGRFGSAATFASLAASSAPGQLPLHSVRATIDALAATG